MLKRILSLVTLQTWYKKERNRLSIVDRKLGTLIEKIPTSETNTNIVNSTISPDCSAMSVKQLLNYKKELEKELVAISGKPIPNIQFDKNSKEFKEATDLRLQKNSIRFRLAKIITMQNILIFLLVIFISLVMSIIFPDTGKEIGKEYYSSVSNIFPILLIALYLNNPKHLNTKINYSINFLEKNFKGLIPIIYGETVSLAALALNYTNSIIFFLSISSLFWITIVLIYDMQLRHY